MVKIPLRNLVKKPHYFCLNSFKCLRKQALNTEMKLYVYGGSL